MTGPASLARAHIATRALSALLGMAVAACVTLAGGHPAGHRPAEPSCSHAAALAAGDALLRRTDRIQTEQARIQADLDRELLAAASGSDPARRMTAAAAALAAARASGEAAARAADTDPGAAGPRPAPPSTAC